MKILQVNSLFRSGSTGKITSDIHEELLKRGIESVVCYGRGDVSNERNIYKICSDLYTHFNSIWFRVTGIMYGGSIVSTGRLIRIIKKERPDVVHLQCLNSQFVNIYRLIRWLKNNHIPTVITLHAEFMYTGWCGYAFECEQWKKPDGCGYHEKCPQSTRVRHTLFRDKSHTMWKMMKNAFVGWNDSLVVASVSPWLCERAKTSPILNGKKHCVVLNGINTDYFYPRDKITINEIKKKLGLTESKVIFHATAYLSSDPNHIKGGYYLVELAKRMPLVKFVVAGNYDKSLTTPKNVILLGEIRDQDMLASFFSMADLTVLTSKKETFSMVTAESLCCGTPIIGFEAGAPEMIAIEGFSEFVEYGNIELLATTAKKWLNLRINKDLLVTSAEIYSRKNMVNEYIKIYMELISKE